MLAADGILANGSNAASADNDALVQSTIFEGMAGCVLQEMPRTYQSTPVNFWQEILARGQR